VSILDDLNAAIDATAQTHFGFCTHHDYENEDDPRVQLCRTVFALDFTASDDPDDVTSLAVELTGSQSDVERGFPVPLASIGYNGSIHGREIAPWKLPSIAFTLLAAFERARGDEAKARAYFDAAQIAITDHLSKAAQPEHTPAGPHVIVRDAHTFDHIEGVDAEVDILPAPAPPAFIVQHGAAGHRKVVSVATGESVDGRDYTDEDGNAPFELRDRLNAEHALGVAA
jgi:hypothetical protein